MQAKDVDSVNIFFSLLRSGLYGSPVPKSDLPDNIDWKAVVALAKKHAVLGTIIESVQFLPDRLRPSSSVSAKMSAFALGLIQTNLVLDKTVAQLVAFLKQYGISGVLLKGQGVARYYRLPQMRQSGDIDFYVGNKAYKKTVGLCKEKLLANKDDWDEIEQHFGFDLNGVRIELHRIATRVYSPIKNKRLQAWIEEQLEHSPSRRTLAIGDTGVTLPSYDFDAIFIFYHAWRHFIMGGIGLRQMSDWAMIFHSHAADIDAERLKENIARFGMTKGWKLFACIAVNHLGVAPEKIPLYDPAYSEKSERVLEEIITGGNFGYYSKAHARTKGIGLGLAYGLAKVRNITGYFFSLFPLVPAEATFLYFNRLYTGTIACVVRALRNKHKH